MYLYMLRGWGKGHRKRGEGHMTVLKWCCWQDSRIVDGFHEAGRQNLTVSGTLLWRTGQQIEEKFYEITSRIKVKVKVKWSRYRPGVAQSVGRGIALLFYDRGTNQQNKSKGKVIPLQAKDLSAPWYLFSDVSATHMTLISWLELRRSKQPIQST